MIVPRLCAALEDMAHRCGHCLIDPPAWAYDLTFGAYADHTIKPLNPANIWWRFGQWALNNAERWEQHKQQRVLFRLEQELDDE